MKNSPFPDANVQFKKKENLAVINEIKKVIVPKPSNFATRAVGLPVTFDDDHVRTMTLLELSPAYQDWQSLEHTITSTSGAPK